MPKFRSTTVLILSATIMFMSFAPFLALGQDGSPHLYIPTSSEMEEEQIDEESSYYYEEDYYQIEEEYYEDQVKEDTSSVSMLTFNFLFYIVYKLKFSESFEEKEESSKTADD